MWPSERERERERETIALIVIFRLREGSTQTNK